MASLLLRGSFISGDKSALDMYKARLLSVHRQSPESNLSSGSEYESDDETEPRSALPNPISPPNRASVLEPVEGQSKNCEEDESCSESSSCTDGSSSSDLLRETLLYQLSDAESYSDGEESSWSSDEDWSLRLHYLCRVFGPPEIPVICDYDSYSYMVMAEKERFHYEYQGGSDDLRLLWSENDLPRFLDRQETAEDEGCAAENGSEDYNEAEQDAEPKKDEKRIAVGSSSEEVDPKDNCRRSQEQFAETFEKLWLDCLHKEERQTEI